MASSSSSFVEKSFNYDVFLSFRGEDTRKTFVDHLYLALVSKGITTYKDDETIEKGERIDDQLFRSIEESRFHIIVFSKNYADSSSCLQELSKIMECQKTKQQTVFPIFYDVEPTEVRNQVGAVGEAFAKHVENQAAWKWRDALKEASSLAGWELKNEVDGHEAKFIQKIVTKISLKLPLNNWSIDDKLVGMVTQVKNVMASLDADSEDDVRIIGIWGMGGAGKTTLARAVFDHISIRFEGKSFVENVREVLKGSVSGLKKLQKQVLRDVLNDQSIKVTSVSDGINKMKKMMRGRKALVVLDDVDDLEHLEALVGNHDWFKLGSRIIITTRDKQVLVAQGVHDANIYNISLLSDNEAICLFNRHAFGREVPNQWNEELSGKFVHYAAGLPLTIKVLGSSLCGKTEPIWLDTLKRLKTIPLDKTLKKLEISYDGLEEDQKEIFLDVACILKGKAKYKAIRILEGCGFHAQIGLEVLEQRSLIHISYNGDVGMHDHIEEMGKNLVRRLHPNEPNKRRRLCDKEEIEEILVNDLGTKATRIINLKNPSIHPATIIKNLQTLKALELLSVYDADRVSQKWVFNEDVKYFPDTLRSLHWTGYHASSLPKTFQANNLVNLEMPRSYISQLWEGGEKKVLEKLRFVDLSKSKLRTFDLRMTQNLETLDLSYCRGMVELQMSFELPTLHYLNLSDSMVSNLSLEMTPNIEKLYLVRCKDLVDLQMPVALPMLNYLDLSHSKVTNLNLGMTPHIENLRLVGCEDLVEFQMPVALPMLNYLDLSHSKVSNLNLRKTPNIQRLHVAQCRNLVELHMPIALPMLNYLDLSHVKLTNLNLGLTPNIKSLNLEGCQDLLDLQIPIALPMLNYLNLSESKVSDLNLGMTPNIKILLLAECKDLVALHMPITLPMLNYLDLCHSKVSNLNLMITPNIQRLHLARCRNLVELQMSIVLPMLNYLYLGYSKVSNLNLDMTPNIISLNLEGCQDLVEVQMTVALPMLNYLNLSESKVSNLNLGMTPNIKNICLAKCKHLVELQTHVALPMLNYLDLSHSKVINFNFGMTPNIADVRLGGCEDLVEFQMSISLPMLNYLDLSHSKVTNVNLGKTPNIKNIRLAGCKDLVELQMPFALPIVNYLDLSHSKVTNLNLGKTPNIENVRLARCKDLVELQMPIALPMLNYLDLSHSKVTNLDLGKTPNIENVHLAGCKDLVELQMPVALSMLNYLDLSHSKVTNLDLGKTQNIKDVRLVGCTGPVKLHIPVPLPMLNLLDLSQSKVTNPMHEVGIFQWNDPRIIGLRPLEFEFE